jgi:hypothetical protein
MLTMLGKCLNNFHCILLRYFANSFHIIYKIYRIEHNDWIMKGIKISCKRKQNLYITYRIINNLQVKLHSISYKKYCTILRRIITEAKNYNKQIKISSNKVKTVEKIIKDTTGKTESFGSITK